MFAAETFFKMNESLIAIQKDRECFMLISCYIEIILFRTVFIFYPEQHHANIMSFILISLNVSFMLFVL